MAGYVCERSPNVKATTATLCDVEESPLHVEKRHVYHCDAEGWRMRWEKPSGASEDAPQQILRSWAFFLTRSDVEINPSCLSSARLL